MKLYPARKRWFMAINSQDPHYFERREDDIRSVPVRGYALWSERRVSGYVALSEAIDAQPDGYHSRRKTR